MAKKNDENPSIIQKVLRGFSRNMKQNHHRILMYPSTKDEADPTNSLGGVCAQTHTHIHTQTDRGVTAFIV